MKTLYPLVSCLLLTATFNAIGQNTDPEVKRAKIMILGCYHMHNPGADVFNVEADDVLKPERQEEIIQVVENIEKFKPTMVALEIKRASERDTLEQANYHAFGTNDFELTRWEGHQIGFRVAKNLEHAKIYNIDEDGNFPFQAMLDWAKANDQTSWIDSMMRKMEDRTNEEASGMDAKTIGEILYEMNKPSEISQGHGIYVAGSQIGKGDAFPGTEVLTSWYRRNARIFTNLYRMTEGKTGEKILVIFGAGHAHILRELIRSAPEFELIEAIDYLKPRSAPDGDFNALLRYHLDAVENKDSLSLKSTLNMGGAYHLILPDGSRMETAQAFYNMHVDWFKDTAWTMEMSILQSDLKGELGTAFVQANYREPDRDGKPYHHKMWITYMCEKIDGQWKVIHDHCSTASKK